MRARARHGIHGEVVIGLLALAMFSLPGVAGAQTLPGVICRENPGVGPFVTQCVAPDPASVPSPVGPLPDCPTSCSAFCPGYEFAVTCWCSLDDAVNAPIAPWEPLALSGFPHVPPDPQPSRVIGVFGPTVEDGTLKANPCVIGTDNVFIHDGNPACLAGWNPPGPYPLVIEECHNAKINAGASASGGELPVIQIVNVNDLGTTGVSVPVGPVRINGLEVIGGLVGIVVETQLRPTVLKAVKADGMIVGIDVAGDKNEVSGATTNDNIVGILVAGNKNLIRSNRVQGNLFDGILVSGDSNNLRGNTADDNAEVGFDIFGNFNIIEGTNRSRNNGGDGFLVTGVGNTLKGNEARTNGGIEFNVPIENGKSVLGSNRAWDEPGTLCYDVAQGNTDKSGNQANGKKVKLPGTIRCP